MAVAGPCGRHIHVHTQSQTDTSFVDMCRQKHVLYTCKTESTTKKHTQKQFIKSQISIVKGAVEQSASREHQTITLLLSLSIWNVSCLYISSSITVHHDHPFYSDAQHKVRKHICVGFRGFDNNADKMSRSFKVLIYSQFILSRTVINK